MKVTVSWSYGHFTPTVVAEIPEEVIEAMLGKGSTQVLQRVPAGNADKALDGHNWPLGKRGGPVKPEDWKRDSIPFNAENAAKVQKAFTTTQKFGEGDDAPFVDFTCTGVVEHVEGETGTSRKRATALVDTLFTTEESKKALTDMLKMLGMKDVESATKEQLITFAHSKGLGSK